MNQRDDDPLMQVLGGWRYRLTKLLRYPIFFWLAAQQIARIQRDRLCKWAGQVVWPHQGVRK